MLRGYNYDHETGLYYLQSRYYNPETGRFLNADRVISDASGDIRGYNFFAYCFNNPVNMSDSSGHWPQWIKDAANWLNDSIIQPIVNSFSPRSLPTEGEPGSSQTLPNPDGTPKQKRWYGPDGKAERDRDYNHQGDIPFPHDHEWKDGKRGEHLPPSPEYEFSWEPVHGVGIIIACGIGIVLVAVDDATVIGIIDDFLFVPLGAGVGEGLIMVFG